MNLELSNRTAVVTGASKGLGAEIVRLLCAEGMRVAICARDSESLRGLAREMVEKGHDVLPIPTDVRKVDDINRCVKEIGQNFGSLDVLVNNVGGVQKFGPFESLSDEDWIDTFELNVLSTVRFTRGLLPLIKSSTLKRIINISSLSAIQPGRWNPHYTTTKAATVNLSKILANSLASENVLVNCVCPGPIHTDSWERNIVQTAGVRGISLSEAREAVEKSEAAKVPLGTVGETHQIAAAVAFLASPLSSWTTGTCFHINGGKLAAAL